MTTKIIVSMAIAGIVALAACTTVETGFLSKNLYYIDNPLYTAQGSITVSSSMVVDGSTTPVMVKLTKVVNASGEDVMDEVTKPDTIDGFKGAVSYLDSTLALLKAKLVKSVAVPLSVNEIGGRIQLTPATKHIATGEYIISTTVSNIRGSVDLPNICKIIVTGTGSSFIDYGGAYAGAFDASTGSYLYGVGMEQPKITFTKTAINKIVYKFLDRDGKLYNAKTGGITARKLRWSMKQFDPYYAEVRTDSTVEYQYPSVPNAFPVFQNPGINGIIPRGNFGVFPAIPAARNSTGQAVFAFMDQAFFDRGTYVVTVKFTDIAWQ